MEFGLAYLGYIVSELLGRKMGYQKSPISPIMLAVVFGLIGLVTGPLWARKAWGVWWQWDARLTMALLVEMIFVGYLLLRKYGGPGSDKLAAENSDRACGRHDNAERSAHLRRSGHQSGRCDRINDDYHHRSRV